MTAEAGPALLAGRALLVAALAFATYGVVASLYGARRRRGARANAQGWIVSARRATYATFYATALAFLVLEAAFLRSDFTFELVATHSSTTTPAFYRATALWSSQAGSLLLWVVLLAGWSSLALHLTRGRARDIAPYATAVLLGFAMFFLGLLVLVESPFRLASPTPAEGLGLAPLLRHPAMMIHPPMLYSGYTLFAIPFAFAVGALATGQLSADWIRLTRPFALAAWTCLGAGVVLGARWSYTELGWGGYWAWDAVENAALMPWLTATAFLHSVKIQERRGMLKVWNVSLVLATGILAVLGTFLVRSGILPSIHAFGASTLGVPFLVLIVTMIAGSVVLVAWRADGLRAEHRLDSLLSREAAFVMNNLVLVAICFVVLWGTFFPIISEALSGHAQAVGPPWFSRYVVPLALVLVLLSGLAPGLTWRRGRWAAVRRAIVAPALVGLGTAVALVVAGIPWKPAALAMFCLAAFVLAVTAREAWHGARARRALTDEQLPLALVSLVVRNRHRYGGYVVHAGLAALMVGVAASSSFRETRDVRLAPGQTARVGSYDVTYARATGSIDVAANASLEKMTLGAELTVRRGAEAHVLRPARSYFPEIDGSGGTVTRFFAGGSTSEVGLATGLRRDVWAAVAPDVGRLDRLGRPRRTAQRVALTGDALHRAVAAYRASAPPATFRILISPLVSWIWLGAAIMVTGGLIALWPSRRGRRRRESKPREAPGDTSRYSSTGATQASPDDQDRTATAHRRR